MAPDDLAECQRFVRDGGRAMVGLHAAFTCSDETIEAAAGLARDLGVGVHVHVAEGTVDHRAGARLAPYAADDWLLVHCVGLDGELPGTIAHRTLDPKWQRGSGAKPGAQRGRDARARPATLGHAGCGVGAARGCHRAADDQFSAVTVRA